MIKILYVEDNEENIFMLEARLKRKNYEVFIARDGLEGINMARKLSPDLILMDVGLPILDGYKATQHIKNDEVTKNIPVIILTAYALTSDRDKAFAAGASEYESKPVNFTALLAKIVKLVSNTSSITI